MAHLPKIKIHCSHAFREKEEKDLYFADIFNILFKGPYYINCDTNH